MKQIKIYTTALLSVLFNLLTSAQTATHNYIKTETMLEASENRKLTNVQYYDQYGRLEETASNGFNGSAYVYTFQNYDVKGRLYKSWLPVPIGMSPDYKSQADIENDSYDYYEDEWVYTSNEYDGADRLVFHKDPGEEWDGNWIGIETKYKVNTANSVRRYRATSNSLFDTQSYYNAGDLYIVETIDEDNKLSQRYTNKIGQLILERRNGNNDTYYVYDDLGLLRYVLTPDYQDTHSVSLSAYEYQYDNCGRIIKKILPQCEYIQYWYGTDDRLLFMQDARLRAKGLYRFTFYDQLGRLAIQGTCSSCSPGSYHAYVTFNCNQSGIAGSGYVLSVPGIISGPQIESVYYYDNYNYQSLTLFQQCPQKNLLTATTETNTHGLPTGSITSTSADSLLFSSTYYDWKGRPTSQRHTQAFNKAIIEDITYSYTDKPLTRYVTLYEGQTTKATVLRTDTYDTANDRLMSSQLTINNDNSHVITHRTYDALGRLSADTRSGNAGSITYGYNVRSWPTTIEGRGFKEWIHYVDGQGDYLYNGNISSIEWQTDDDGIRRGYKFSYDGLNRLLSGVYGEGMTLSQNNDRYTEQVTGYTRNGSIIGLKRHGQLNSGDYGIVDNLTVSLLGNRPVKVDDAAGTLYYSGSFDFRDGASLSTEYTYDGCGSLLTDANKGVALIDYDLNGMPLRVQFTNGCVTEHTYDAWGRKLRTIHRTAVPYLTVPIGSRLELTPAQTQAIVTTEYADDFLIENGSVSKYLFDGGYCTISANGSPAFHYYTRDHIGSNRAVVAEDGTLEQVTHYYPFGGIYSNAGMAAGLQRYKFNGKEFDRMHGLDWQDFGARSYDAAFPMWTSIDRQAESYYATSPYAYCLDNPIHYSDPDGNSVWTKAGKAIYKIGRRVTRDGFSALNQADTYLSTISDITDAVGTISDTNASTTDRVRAGFSLASEVLPVSLNDIADMGKLVRRTIHGNSKLSTRAQHAYDIINTKTKKIIKIGVSGGKIRKDGKSYRAEQQVRKWNKEYGEDIYRSEITHKEATGKGAREKILDYEEKRSNKYRKELETENKHQRP